MKAPVVNPFLNNNEFHLKTIQIYNTRYVGEGAFMEEYTRKYLVEEQPKVSVYKIGNNSQFCTFLFEVLSSAGRNLFLYIIATIGENKDTINLHTDKVTNEMKISRNTLQAAKDNLRDNGIISVYKGNEYWVNPFFIFRGNRIDYYQQQCPDCIKVVSKQSVGQSLVDKMKE